MVAYSFQKRFVAPICLGLGRDVPAGFEVGSGIAEQEPKTHTIRALGRRHARAGEIVQLYFGQRTKACIRLGIARCTNSLDIFINVTKLDGGPRVHVAGRRPYLTARELDEFARTDGFGDFDDMALFWREHHPPAIRNFRGVIIFWERIT